MNKNSRLVYSTDKGRITEIPPTPRINNLSSDGVRVGRETKGRNGKGVTVISGLAMESAELKALAKKLKQMCGTGGTAKNGKIEIQGDQRDMIIACLQKKGITAKRCGG